MKFGAIDIGTNAARLLVGEVCYDGDHAYVKKHSYSRIPLRLGDEVFDQGRLSKKKIDQFIDCIQAFKLIAHIFEVEQLRAVATSAMREASNGIKVQEKIKVLRSKMCLKDLDQYSDVYVKSCKSHAERLIEMNARAILRQMPDGKNLRVDANGRIQPRRQQNNRGNVD